LLSVFTTKESKIEAVMGEGKKRENINRGGLQTWDWEGKKERATDPTMNAIPG
jgi:hypothetical protein